ncbi:MAG: hypothetical protein M3Y54_16525 [Bacteroidota bacterium]|nr:hypothetical protein [Bacteroidota bacterium]
MRPFLLLLIAGATLLAASGCEKPEIRDIAAQEKKWVGTWQVAEIKTLTTDTLGHKLSETTLTGQGTVEFRLAPGGTGGAAFKPAVFEGACVQSELVQYFVRKGAGDRTATNGWELYWDADPDGARLQVWAVGALSSYHRTETSDSNNDSPRQLFYAYTPPSSGPPPNQMVLITWQLRK